MVSHGEVIERIAQIVVSSIRNAKVMFLRCSRAWREVEKDAAVVVVVVQAATAGPAQPG